MSEPKVQLQDWKNKFKRRNSAGEFLKYNMQVQYSVIICSCRCKLPNHFICLHGLDAFYGHLYILCFTGVIGLFTMV